MDKLSTEIQIFKNELKTLVNYSNGVSTTLPDTADCGSGAASPAINSALKCKKGKREPVNTRGFEVNLYQNLALLSFNLQRGLYRPSRSVPIRNWLTAGQRQAIPILRGYTNKHRF